MPTIPEFDFQLSRNIRLRGWGVERITQFDRVVLHVHLHRRSFMTSGAGRHSQRARAAN